LLSFSRSFWVAGIISLGMLFLLACAQRISFRSFLARMGAFMCVAIAAVALVWVTMNFPYPRTAGGSFTSLLEDRATATQESGIGSRWSLLPPLLTRIAEHPFVGSGFGATVTYRSSDPRIVASSARGNNFYTTYAFEWGYLDLWLKFGLIGIFFYGIVLWRIGTSLWRLQEYGWLLGLVALLVTNIFSPYLNHPLGIGYLLLCVAVCFVPAPSFAKGGFGRI
ncbi:O-antigen ligase family protein, partial [Candidatus Uhrbacteria bacterium]|nr:O-antigen ligase family protein [Candidatus Uhrbacteria bacterium]